jgi:uncharacterized protein YicC (UPF0701 family)
MNKPELSELSKKIIQGITEANRKLVEQRAAEGRSLVVFIDGETKSVPAKDLLAQLNLAKHVPAR